MTKIADGSYVILTMKDLTYALDIYGNADYNGANLMLYKRHGDIGGCQLVNVVTHENGYQSIRIPATGKCFCISGGVIQSENFVHQWAWHETGYSSQYPDGDHRCLWTTELIAGVTATVDGIQYPVYGVRSAKNSNYVLTVYWAQASNYQSICIYPHSNLDVPQSQWVFIPVNTLGKAAYRLASKVNLDACIGIADGSNGVGSNVYIVGNSDTNAQRWIAVQDTGYKLINAENGLLMRAVGTENGSNVELSKTLDSYSKWAMNIDGSSEGAFSDFSIELQEGIGQVLDAANGVSNGSKIGTNLEVYSNWGGLNQRWAAIMESLYDDTLKSVTDIRFSRTKTGAYQDKFVSNGSAVYVYPSFIGGNDNYQIRYRWRGKKITKEGYGDWSDWMSIADGSTTDSGWGSEFSPNANISKNGSRMLSNKAIVVDAKASEYYVKEIEVSVRAWTAKAQNAYINDYPGHGPSASASFVIGFKPVLTISGLSFRPKGVGIAYSSNLAVSDNSLSDISVVSSNKAIVKSQSVTGLSKSGTIYVPFKLVPAANSTATITAKLSTSEGIESDVSTYTGAVSYAGRNTNMTAPTISSYSIGMLKVAFSNVSENDIVKVCVKYEDRDVLDEYEVDTSLGWAYIPIRYDVSYTLYSMQESSSSGDWNIWSESHTAFANPHSYMFLFEDEDGSPHVFAIKVNVREHPRYNRNLTAGTTIYNTFGDRFDSVSYSGVLSEDISVSGVLSPILENVYSTVELAEQAAKIGYMYYRSPKSDDVYRIAITNVSFDDTNPEYTSVTLNAKRIG